MYETLVFEVHSLEEPEPSYFLGWSGEWNCQKVGKAGVNAVTHKAGAALTTIFCRQHILTVWTVQVIVGRSSYF